MHEVCPALEDVGAGAGEGSDGVGPTASEDDILVASVDGGGLALPPPELPSDPPAHKLEASPTP